MSQTNNIKGSTKIHFGTGGLAFALALFVVIALAMYTQANLLFVAFGVMVGGLVVSTLWSWRTLKKLHIERLPPSYGVVDDQMALRYYLSNNSFLPAFNITIAETWGSGLHGWKKVGPASAKSKRLNARPHGWVLHIGPRQKVQAQSPCWPKRRGHLHLEKILISSGFPFGLIKKTVIVEQEGDILVFPKLYRMNKKVMVRLSRNEPMGERQIQRGGGQEEFFALREYRPGDSLKVIDWKHSARTGKTIAREMTLPGPPKLIILLDIRYWKSNFNDSAITTEDIENEKKKVRDLQERAIVIAASLICDAHTKGYRVGLGISGVANSVFPANNSMPHIIRLLTALAKIDLDNITSDSAAITDSPSVEVHLDESGESFVESFRYILLATNIDEYVAEPRGAMNLLKTNTPVRSRRQLIKENEKKSNL